MESAAFSPAGITGAVLGLIMFFTVLMFFELDPEKPVPACTSGKLQVKQMAKNRFFLNLIGALVIALAVYHYGRYVFEIALNEFYKGQA